MYAFHKVQHVRGIDLVIEGVVFFTPVYHAYCMELLPRVVGFHHRRFTRLKPSSHDIRCDYKAGLVQTKRGSSLLFGAFNLPSRLFLNASAASGEAL